MAKSSPFSHQFSLHIIIYIILRSNFYNPKRQLKSSCSVRRPIGFRTPPDQIPYAVRSDSVRCPTHFLHIFLIQSQSIHNNLKTPTKHFLSIYTLILGV